MSSVDALNLLHAMWRRVMKRPPPIPSSDTSKAVALDLIRQPLKHLEYQ